MKIQSWMTRFACIGGASALTLAPQTAGAHPLDDLQPGTWYEVSGSLIEDHFPDPAPPNWPGAIIDAWGGGTFDTYTEQLLVWGGGHADYGGNEVYAFDVAAQTWGRPWGPTPGITSVPARCSTTYPDAGNATLGDDPSARHTYDGMEYMPTTGSVWSSGGFRFCGNTGSDSATWLYTADPPRWDRAQDAIEEVGTPSAAWDPVTERVYYIANYIIQAYDPVTDTYEQITEVDGGWWLSGTSAIDPIGHLLVTVSENEVRVVDLDTGAITLDQPTTGNIGFGGSPGMAWDPNLERFVVWSGSASVYSLDTVAWEWLEHAPAPGNTVVPTDPAENGTFGRFRYMPSRNAYIVVNSTSEPVFYYKLTDGAGVPPRPPTPPTGGSSGSGGSEGESGGSETDGGVDRGTTGADPATSGGAGSPTAPQTTGSPATGGGVDTGGSAAGVDSGSESGCSCRHGAPSRSWWPVGLLAFAAACTRRRRVVTR